MLKATWNSLSLRQSLAASMALMLLPLPVLRAVSEFDGLVFTLGDGPLATLTAA